MSLISRILIFALISLASVSSAVGQAGGGPCAPGFGALEFAFAGDLLAQPQAFCPPGVTMIESSIQVIPDPPVSTPPASGNWQSEAGDEGDYVFRRTYRCEGGPQQIAEYEVALVTRLSLVGLEVSQGVADAELTGVAGRNLLPGRRTVVRAFVEYEGPQGSPVHKYTPKLRAFQVDYPQGGDPVCLGEFSESPLDPENAGGAHVARLDPLSHRGRFKSTLNFRLPEAWVQPGVFIRIESDDGRPLFSLLNATGPAFGGGNLAVNNPPPPDADGTDGADLDLRLIAVPWLDAQQNVHIPTDATMRDIVRRLKRGLPFPDIDIRYDVLETDSLALPASPDDDDVYTLIANTLKVLARLRLFEFFARANAGDPETPVWHGVLVDRPRGTFFYGDAQPGSTSVAFDLASIPTTHLHEVGHVLGLTHPGHSQFGNGPQCTSPCPAGTKAAPCCSCSEVADPDWPNIGVVRDVTVATLFDLESGSGPREIWGLDIDPGPGLSPRPLPPSLYFEAMSYCDGRYGARGQWLSDLNWQIVTSGLDLVMEDVPPVGMTQSRVRIYTGATDGAAVELSPVYEVDTFAQVSLGTEGEFTFIERDGAGTILSTGLFDVEPVVLEKPDAAQSFLFAIPAPFNPDVRRAEFLQGGIPIAAIDASANAPTVNVLFPNGGEVLPQGDVTLTWTSSDSDGDDLTHWVQLSLDDGTTWETLAVAWPETTLEIDTTRVPAGDTALIRVIASDGFLNAEDSSDGTFEIVDGPPEIELLSPADGLVVSGEQLVTLEARAFDVTDGVLRGASIEWASSLDGPLGTGRTVDVRASGLTLGSHTLVATATDSDTNVATAQAVVHVEAFSMPGPGAPVRVDLEIELTPPAPPQRVGETAVFTAAIRNWGRDTATGVGLEVVFPPGLSATIATPTAGGCTVTPGLVDCSPGDLAPGAEVLVSIDANGVLQGTATITATATTADLDVDPSDNTVSLALEVREAADPDMDGDGFTAAEGDCDDAEPLVNPASGEFCNGIDDNCDGDTDETGDSLCFVASSCTTGVCDPVLGCQLSPLGNDTDGDGFFAPQCGGTDCDDTNMAVWGPPATVTNVLLVESGMTTLTWDDQGVASGPGTGYDVLSGGFQATTGFEWNAACLTTVPTATFAETRPAPAPGFLDWYLIRATNSCGIGDPGSVTREGELPSCP